MKAYRGSKTTGILFLNLSSRRGVIVQLHPPAASPPRKKPGTYLTGDSVLPAADVDPLEKKKFLTLLGCEPWVDRSVAFICTWVN